MNITVVVKCSQMQMTNPIAELKVAYFIDISQHMFATNSPYKTFGKRIKF